MCDLLNCQMALLPVIKRCWLLADRLCKETDHLLINLAILDAICFTEGTISRLVMR